MQRYCLFPWPAYLCLYLLIVGGFIIVSSSATREDYYRFVSHVTTDGYDRRDS